MKPLSTKVRCWLGLHNWGPDESCAGDVTRTCKHCNHVQYMEFGMWLNMPKLKTGNTKCRTWMYNESLNKSKQIPNEMVQEFLKNNWKVGRLIK
jgi:hypothetical protein